MVDNIVRQFFFYLMLSVPVGWVLWASWWLLTHPEVEIVAAIRSLFV